jgi:hypothetical protein
MRRQETIYDVVEIDRVFRKLRLYATADILETRLRHAQSERLALIDFLFSLV